MKSILCLLVIILFSLTNTDQILGAEEPDAVIDSDGDKLSAGTPYYILPVIIDNGGGVTLAITGDKQCPLDVVQDPSPYGLGLPVTFTPVNPEQGVITESTDLNFKFSSPLKICVETPTVWTLSSQSSDGQYFITTGGTEGNPGIETLYNWFKIEKPEGASLTSYKLVYCPTVCNYCESMCEDIGIYVDDATGMRRLALSDDAGMRFMFVKKEAAKAEA